MTWKIFTWRTETDIYIFFLSNLQTIQTGDHTHDFIYLFILEFNTLGQRFKKKVIVGGDGLSRAHWQIILFIGSKTTLTTIPSGTAATSDVLTFCKWILASLNTSGNYIEKPLWQNLFGTGLRTVYHCKNDAVWTHSLSSDNFERAKQTNCMAACGKGTYSFWMHP